MALIVALVILVLYPVTLVRSATGSMGRVSALPSNHLGGAAAGRNFLVVGSDSRVGTHMDQVQGQRSDTIMLLHVPTHGQSVLMSIPRDSYVPIPGHGKHKINAAFAIGGPRLLVQTVEQLTGINIDDYVQTNLGGFSKVVDAVGGVRLCPKFDMDDPDAHINLKKGCQQMNGATALGYARARHSDPQGDLGRAKRQREVLAAITSKAESPTMLLNPFASYPLARSGGQALTVDRSTSTWALTRFLLGMRSVSGSSGGFSVTAPVGNVALATPTGGSAVELAPTRAPEMFQAIKDGDTARVKQLAAG